MQLETYKMNLPEYQAGPFIPQGMFFLCYDMSGGFPAEDITYLHYHPHYEIGICKKGKGTMFCDGHILKIQKGDVIFIPVQKRHFYRSDDENKLCQCQSMFFKPYDLLKKLGVTDVQKIKELISDSGIDKLPVVISAKEFPELNESIKKIFNEYYENGENGVALSALYFYEFILYAQKYLRTKVETEVCVDKRIENAIRYMTINYASNITLDILADECFISKGHLVRIFTKQYGVSPIKWLNNFRLRVAKEQLANTNLSIAEICEKSGFHNASDLYRHFVKMMDMSPAAYRIQQRTKSKVAIENAQTIQEKS